MSGTFWDRIAGLYDIAEKSNRRVNVQALRQVTKWVPTGAAVLEKF